MRKAPRDYGITNEHLMYANVLIIQCLQKLYNVIFTYGAIPKEWKRGLIVPIFKGGDNSCMYKLRILKIRCKFWLIIDDCHANTTGAVIVNLEITVLLTNTQSKYANVLFNYASKHCITP